MKQLHQQLFIFQSNHCCSKGQNDAFVLSDKQYKTQRQPQKKMKSDKYEATSNEGSQFLLEKKYLLNLDYQRGFFFQTLNQTLSKTDANPQHY